MRSTLALPLILLAAFALPPQAMAHAQLKRANPRVGSTVQKAPQSLQLWFSEALEPAFSTLEVLDPAGTRVDRDDKRVDPADRTLFEVSLRPLTPGTYKVLWHALSVDTHVTDGSFTFTVAP